jgi:hypothetical protein
MTGGFGVRGKAGPIWVRKVFNCLRSLHYRFTVHHDGQKLSFRRTLRGHCLAEEVTLAHLSSTTYNIANSEL